MSNTTIAAPFRVNKKARVCGSTSYARLPHGSAGGHDGAPHVRPERVAVLGAVHHVHLVHPLPHVFVPVGKDLDLGEEAHLHPRHLGPVAAATAAVEWHQVVVGQVLSTAAATAAVEWHQVVVGQVLSTAAAEGTRSG